MTDEPPDADASAPATCTFTPDDLDVPEPLRPDTGCSRPVWEDADAGRCVWHADGAAKPPDKLAATVGDGNLAGARARASDLTSVSFPEGSILSGVDLSGAALREADLRKADLRGADLSRAALLEADLREADLPLADLRKADLRGADLSRADLTGADLREADLHRADLCEAVLREADLTDANLTGADLTDANLTGADLTDANLWEADLSGATLRGADFQDALLTETTLADVSLARSTTIGDPAPRIKAEGADSDLSAPALYDMIARTNHELRAAYNDNGLTGRARRARVRERKARRREARAEGGRGWVAWVWSVLSQVFTGYGIQLGWVLGMMSVLYVGSAVVYWAIGGMTPVESLYYSIVTFTTSPPDPQPTGGVVRAMAGIETFAGTAAIVFLGYVLGTREQV